MKPCLRLLIGLLLLAAACKKDNSCETCPPDTPNHPPVASAGSDMATYLPKDSVLLDGSASSDADGRITQYRWSQVQGPAPAQVLRASDSKTPVHSMQRGVYQFELMVTDNAGATARDTVQVAVKDPTADNHPPVAQAGADVTITLPINWAALDGSASRDPDDAITAYRWHQVAGPSAAIVTTPEEKYTNVTDLFVGVYQFQLKVTDAGGLFSFDTVQVTVAQPAAATCDVSGRPVVDLRIQDVGRLSQARIPLAAAAGGKIVFAGGPMDAVCSWDMEYSSDVVDIYDVATHAWSTARLSKERSRMATVTAGNKIFFAGGVNWEAFPGNMINGNVSYDNVDIYEASANTWKLVHLSKAREAITTATVGSKVIFAGGIYYTGQPNPGQVWNVTDAVDVYDGSTDSWSTARLSVARAGMRVYVLGDKVYFCGGNGYGPADALAQVVDIYDSRTNTWSVATLSQYPDFASGYQVGHFITFFDHNKVTIKDLTTGTLIKKCLSGISSGVWLTKETLVFLLDNYGAGYSFQSVDLYNTRTGEWSVGRVSSTVQGTNGAVAVATNQVYFTRGYSVENDCFQFHNEVYLLDW